MMERMFKKLGFLAAAVLLVLAPWFPLVPPAAAAGARLFLAPAAGTYHIGDYLSVEVLVNTGGNVTNAYKALLSYPADKLEAVAVSSGGSICNLWIPPSPSYANAGNNATFECGTTSRFKGTAGRIGTITFLAKSAGTATVSIVNGSQVKKADGRGTEILSVREAATFDLQEFPAGAAAISSSTHPDQNAWYQAQTVDLSWSQPEGTDGFSYLLSQKPADTPDNLAEGTETSKTYANLADGIWYFHLKSHRAEGWNSVSRFRIQIDHQPPAVFTLVPDQPADRITRAPLISFATTDETSGVERYEIAMDGGEFAATDSPYRFERIRGGTRAIVVRAIDRAGNIREANLTLSVISVAAPVILRPAEGEGIPFLSPLTARIDVTTPGAVELAVDGKIFATLTANSETEGKYRRILLPGEHNLAAIFVNADGIESEPATVKFVVDPRRVYLLGLVLPWYLGYPILLAVFVLLLVLFRRLIRKIRASRRKAGTEKPTPKEERKPEDSDQKPSERN